MEHFEALLKVWVESKNPNDDGIVNVVIDLRRNAVVNSLVNQGYRIKHCEVLEP